MKLVKELEKGKGVNIIQREGKDFVLANSKGGFNTTYILKEENDEYKVIRKNIWNATLDYCTDAVKSLEFSKKVFYSENNKLYSDAFISVTFTCNLPIEVNRLKINAIRSYINNSSSINKNNNNKLRKELLVGEKDVLKRKAINYYIKNKTVIENNNVKYKYKKHIKELSKSSMTTDEIREDLYNNGFDLLDKNNNKVHYVRYKRSSGSSRVGKCLFIREDLYIPLMKWTLMGLNINVGDEIDLASLEAYISLTLSSMIDDMIIDVNNILILKDAESDITEECMVTEQIGEGNEAHLQTSRKTTTITNKIWDGESLMDSSLFGEKYKDKGMLLLRNQFVKTCAFNTNIQQYYEDNKITIEDIKKSPYYLYTKATSVKDIKLITTPSSLKYSKFGSIQEYLDNMDNTWGIVKYDKPTHHMGGELVSTHYQLLNSLDATKQEVKKIIQPTKDYMWLLKNDTATFRKHLKMLIEEDEECNHKLEEELDEIYLSNTNGNVMINTLLTLNDDFVKTDECIEYRKDICDSYRNNVRLGHILIHGNYSVLCGNGMEMLMASCNRWNGQSIIEKGTVYCSNFGEKKLLCTRSPQPSPSCLLITKNKIYKIIDTYFNSSRQIVHINSIEENNLERLSSADYDSDQMLITDDKLYISIAEKHYNKYPVSVNCVRGKKTPRYYTNQQKADLDIKTSKNLIGEIINFSQQLNSKMSDMIKKNEDIEDILKDISTLNIMSCIEIDKAKKEFDIDNAKELNKLREKYSVLKKPLFFKYVSRSYKETKEKIEDEYKEGKITLNEKNKKISILNEKYCKYDCTMDYLELEIDTFKKIRSKPIKKEERETILDLLTRKYSDMLNNTNKAQRTQIQDIMNLIEQADKDRRNIWSSNDEGEIKYKKSTEIENELIGKIEKKDISDITLITILKRLEQKNNKTSKFHRLILTTLYKSKTEMFLDMFKIEDKVEILVKAKKENANTLNIYGIKYNKKRVKRIIKNT